MRSEVSAIDRADANLFAAIKACGAPVTIDEAAAEARMPIVDALDAVERLVMRRVLRMFRPIVRAGMGQLRFEPAKRS